MAVRKTAVATSVVYYSSLPIAVFAIIVSYLLLCPPAEVVSSHASFVCGSPQWKVRFFSHDPVMAHIENFLTDEERKYLLNLQQGRYERSDVRYFNGTRAPSPIRTSWTGRPSSEDPVVQCVMSRAAEIQGFLPVERIEQPQITYYEQGQEFKSHFDWAADEDGKVWDREASTFAILDASCTDCGTSFPLLEMDWSHESDRWCEFFDCNSTTLTTKPVLGSALYWRNVLKNGKGDQLTAHAGLPVMDGYKAGMNIWTSV